MSMKKQFATEYRACVVGALAPYNHGLPLAGAETTEKSGGEDLKFTAQTHSQFFLCGLCGLI
jgi:hypothetical protein